jgi:UDP-N-acetylmuramoyl-tripeptide--D-alanyl-D-alanine ligase
LEDDVKALDVQTIAAAAGGRLIGPDCRRQVTGVSTDTRTLKPGDLFVALSGERFDGHDFIPAALSAGAAALLVRSDRATARPAGADAVPVIAVSDTVRALGDLARAYRRLFNVTVLGITGSNGKTTTKEMIVRVLSAGGRSREVLGSVKSYNNHVGLPLTLFGLTAAHRCAVLEMGTSAPGEIRRLAEIAGPDLGVVTTVSDTHLAGLGSREGVARAKSELIQALPADGTAILNGDDPLVAAMARLATGRVIRFGRTPESDVFVADVRETEGGVTFRLNGRRLVRLKTVGAHNALNAAAAVAVCRRLGLAEDAIVSALEGFTAPPMRLSLVVVRGVRILDDVYNANPQSMRGALATLAGLPCSGRRVFVCGAMRELGERSEALHREVGGAAAQAGVHLLVTVGDEAAPVGAGAAAAGLASQNAHHCGSTDEAAALLPTLVREGDLVLIKGSRAMALERVVGALCA